MEGILSWKKGDVRVDGARALSFLPPFFFFLPPPLSRSESRDSKSGALVTALRLVVFRGFESTSALLFLPFPSLATTLTKGEGILRTTSKKS